MNIYIIDEAYKKRIKRFMQMHYGLSQKINLLEDLAQLDRLPARQLLTDDLSLVRPDCDVHYIVDAVDARPNYHCKHQNFKHLIEQLVGQITAVDDAVRTRLIVVTSLVGGVGKTTVARQMAKLLGRGQPSLVVALLTPQSSGRQTLSEFVVTQRHNSHFNLANYVVNDDGVAHLSGFFSPAELSDAVLAGVFDGVRQLFAKSPYREIVIDAPPLPYCQSLVNYVDCTYLVRSEARRLEEQKIIDGLQLPLNRWQLINSRPLTRQRRSLPDLTSAAHYQEALTNILIEDGLYEY